ncbi:3-deoxy-7-phosphoheptulonate synthase [Collinsella sp. AGMB00827]|uniref:3-deoxy-7-phosphoheptulonate synthase n=1 Tax=Collinsella ureilytica TaxID=2869515 RepID=A0ABS7ML36_9ACTN|nr:3-deoxy-7-phosphoheptulonate synthase [Collinsella urealyticum]MBY4798076.1 3-deoxy-7-phosphoheptulonate synthase [Collinsella urealyticum]
MIAILTKNAPDEAVEHLSDWIRGKGLDVHISRGANEIIVGLVGDTTKIDPILLESMDIVERVQRVSEPFKKANRKFHPDDSIIDCGHGVLLGGGFFQVIAGPCSVEGDNLIRIARRVKAAGATMLRGGAYKPRTSPYASQGMGEAGLDLLLEAGSELDMPVVTEVMDPRDVALFLDKGVDVMQIGARNAQNFPLLREVGKTSTPVLLKRGMAGTIDELLMAAEYIMSEGNPNVMVCERGIRTFETRTRNTFDLNAIPAIHHLSHLPIVADPSHATGHTRYVGPMARAAVAAGADGLEIEVHDDPAHAWSDGAQALTPDMFDQLMKDLLRIRSIVAPAKTEA